MEMKKYLMEEKNKILPILKNTPLWFYKILMKNYKIFVKFQ